MPRSEQTDGPEFDWRSWLALAWMILFGILYAGMLLREKLPGLYARLFANGP